MTDFTIYTMKSAPEAAQPLLEDSIASFGMIPNLHGVMAESPAVLLSYKFLHTQAQNTSFSPEELTVVWQTAKVDDSITEALRHKTPLPDKLEVLRETTKAILLDRGNPDTAKLTAFFDAGYSKQQLLEIILILAQKVMSNYIKHLADTSVDKAFAKYEWHPA